jgi:hypothetical protein
MKTIAFLATALIALVGCHPSTETISAQVKTLLQSKLNSDPDFKDYHLTVEKVDLIHDEGNKYAGIATISMGGEEHSVGLKILADGEKVIYETDQGAFLFAVQHALRDTINNVFHPDAAVANQDSRFNVAAYCQSLAIGKENGMEIQYTCREHEKAAQAALSAQQIPSDVESHCRAVAQAAGGSYQVMNVCINQTLDIGSGNQFKDGLKAGWSNTQLSIAAAGCVEGIINPARANYESRAAQAGARGDDFPEQAVRTSLVPMCACLTRRIAESLPLGAFMSNQEAAFGPVVNESLSGGRCKPDGFLAEIMEQRNRK